MKKGSLYIVATPIGNLGDITQRAVETLRAVDLIVAEDTRHSKLFLNKLEIQKPMASLHEHNEDTQVEKLCQKLLEGSNLALISDAGTPLISDPGYRLVRQAQIGGICVVPIPGPSAVVAALSVGGLPTDRFVFEGFLPVKSIHRRKQLEALVSETRTLVFYEAPHRILDALSDMKDSFGEDREAVLARELTKTFETIYRAPLGNLLQFVSSDGHQSKGEIVLLVAGATKQERVQDLSEDVLHLLRVLASELPTKQVASLASKITGISKRSLYEVAITLKK